MKNTLKILFALSLVFAMLFSFAACNDSATATDSSSVKSPTLSAADDSSQDADTNTNTAENVFQSFVLTMLSN